MNKVKSITQIVSMVRAHMFLIHLKVRISMWLDHDLSQSLIQCVVLLPLHLPLLNRHKGPFTNTCEGSWCKKGALKIVDPCKGGGLKKIATNFPVKIEFTCFSVVLTRNFHGKKGPWFFCGLKGAPKNFRDIFFLHQAPPYKCLWTVPNGMNVGVVQKKF